MKMKQNLAMHSVIIGIVISLLVACAPDSTKSRISPSSRNGGTTKSKFKVEKFTVKKEGASSKTAKVSCLNLNGTLAQFTSSQGAKQPLVEAVRYTQSISLRKNLINTDFESLESIEQPALTKELISSIGVRPEPVYLLDYFTVGSWPLGSITQDKCKSITSETISGSDKIVEEFTITNATANRLALKSLYRELIISFAQEKLTLSETYTIQKSQTCSIKEIENENELRLQTVTVVQWGQQKKKDATIDLKLALALADDKSRVADSFKSATGDKKGNAANTVSVDLDAFRLTVDGYKNIDAASTNCFSSR